MIERVRHQAKEEKDDLVPEVLADMLGPFGKPTMTP
jgi:hypothetical protein